MYYNGVFNWGGDYSYALTPDYKDTSGNPVSGAYDIKMTNSASGGWLPYAGGTVPMWNFDDSPYTKLTLTLKPTMPNQTWNLYFIKVGDIALPPSCTVNLTSFGPAPVVGQWATYTVPLSTLCVSNTSVYKFGLQDSTGHANTWYADNVGFVP